MADRQGGSRPRVVLVVPSFPKASETFIAAKFAGLTARGWDVHVACHSSPEHEWKRYPELAADPKLRARVHLVARHRPRWLPVVMLPVTFIRTLLAAPGATVRYLRRGASRFGVGILRHFVLDAHIIAVNPDIVHFEFGSLAPEQLHLAPLLGARLSVSFRGYDLNQVALDDPHFYDELWPALDGMHLLGEYLWRRVQERGCPPDAPHTLIPPAVDIELFSPPVRDGGPVGTPDRPLRVVSVGRVEWFKGFEFALGALAELKERGVSVQYRICGHGELFEAVAFARHQLGLDDDVELLGTVPVPVVQEQLAWADVFLHTTLLEAFGNAVIEAQAMALPVVCTDAGGLLDNVVPGETALVVPKRDQDATADALAQLATDGERRLAMGSAGRTRVEDHFRLDHQLDQIEQYLLGVRDATVSE